MGQSSASGFDKIPLERLSPRQSEVLFLVSKGLRNSEIGRHLGLAERTIKWYVSQIFLILDVSNRTELAGLVPPNDFSGESGNRECTEGAGRRRIFP
jgi:DNA-binding NarL/FixJ family response regulator